MMQYKGYIGIVEFDDEAEIFYGEVINTRDVITFEGRTAKQIKKAFADSVESYLAYCKKRKRNPDKPFSGKFVVRLNPEQHRDIYVAAKKEGISLNRWVANSLQAVLLTH